MPVAWEKVNIVNTHHQITEETISLNICQIIWQVENSQYAHELEYSTDVEANTNNYGE